MRMSYNKLWKLLIDKKMKKSDLRKNAKISSSTLAKLTNDENVTTDVLVRICNELKCNVLNESCDVHKNCSLLNSTLFQDRLFVILQRVSVQGYHATVRELQSLIAYLIFGNRSCKAISRTTGSNQYNLVNLVFSGKGALFDAIRNAIDPVAISHPMHRN